MTQKLFFLLVLIGLFSCSKNDIRHDLQNSPTVQITATSKNIHFTTEQMAAISMNGAPTKNDGTQQIAVFPLVIDNQQTNIYAVVNYTDTTTLLTTKFVNYPHNFIAFFDKMTIDSVKRTIVDMPDVLGYALKDFDQDIKTFADNPELVNTPLGYSPTKVVDDDFRPPAGCRVEIENTYIWSKKIESYGPLLTTTWRQGYPFNYFVPNKASTGCVALALGQILKYHKHPCFVVLLWRGVL